MDITYDLYDITPILGSYNWNYGKGHMYKIPINQVKTDADKKSICDWVKSKYEKRYGFSDYQDGDYYIVKISYGIIGL